MSGAAVGTPSSERTLPLLPVLADLVPQSAVQRGSVMSCHGPAAMSLALALAAGPSQEGAWVGMAGLPSVGLGAAAEIGVVLERLVAVTEPEGPATPFTDQQWADVLAALIDGFDVVVLGPGTQHVRPGAARRLMARLQSRGAVAITVGAPVFGGDLRFECTNATWVGLGDGHGVARGRTAQVELSGRRVPRPRRAHLWLPDIDGQVASVLTAPEIPMSDPASTLRRTG